MDARLIVAELKAARGAGWYAESFRIFRQAPVAWIGLCAGWLTITFGLLFAVPFIGGVIANFLQPVFFAGFAITACRQGAGERIAMADLFSGFKRNVRPLINLGALLLLAEITIIMLMALAGLPMASTGERMMNFTEYAEALKGKEWILAIGALATVAVKGAVWFAPQLIAFHDMSTTQAIRWSVYATISNLGAMVTYGAVLALLFFAALLPWGLGLIVAIPMMAISNYVGYREVFEAPQASEGD